MEVYQLLTIWANFVAPRGTEHSILSMPFSSLQPPGLDHEDGNKGQQENQNATSNGKHDRHKRDDGLDYVMLAVMRMVICLRHSFLQITPQGAENLPALIKLRAVNT